MGIFPYTELKRKGALLSYVMQNKGASKMYFMLLYPFTNYLYYRNYNLKFYFQYQKGIGFQVKVIFLGNTWTNIFKSKNNLHKEEVGLEE